MKKMKKILAFAMSMAMVLGMSVTSLAENGDGYRDKDDTAVVTIKGLDKVADETNMDDTAKANNHPTVALYQVAKGNYEDSGIGLKDVPYVGEKGITVELVNGRYEVKLANPAQDETANDIALIGKKAVNNEVGSSFTSSSSNFVLESDGTFTYTATVNAGAYVAVITEGGNTIYNPVLLTASYDNTGELVANGVDLGGNSSYLYGATAVVKKSKPDIEKTASVDNDKTDTKDNSTINTASVGDEVTYTITPTMPSYPKNATNKTAYIKDTMSKGLTFDYDSLTVTLNGVAITGVADVNNSDVKTFTTSDNKLIATAYKYKAGTDNDQDAFRLAFNYDNVEDATGGIADSTTLVVTYKAVINDDAVVGANTNEAKLIYNNDPMDDGDSYEDPSKEEPDDPNYKDVTEEINDTNTVYTYRLGFKKVGEGDDSTALAGAKFGIYAIDSTAADTAVANKSVEGATLVDIVTTGTDGFAVSGQLSKGTYLIKEISAPATYSLSDTVYRVDVNYGTATTTSTVTKRVYTATAPAEGAKQVGWLKGGSEAGDGGHTGIFYPLDKYTTDSKPADVVAAYLKSETTTTSVTTTGEAEGNGTTLLKKDGSIVGIPNTKLTSLPSTGGIGTTIFTIGGCAIMIVAAGLFFASRRKSTK